MSFTEDELEAFNSILEQRFAIHRQEMEQALEQRLNIFRQDIDRRIEQILTQHAARRREETVSLAQLETIEVQAELPCEELVAMMGSALDERLTLLNNSLQCSVKSVEQQLTLRLHDLRNEIARVQEQG